MSQEYPILGKGHIKEKRLGVKPPQDRKNGAKFCAATYKDGRLIVRLPYNRSNMDDPLNFFVMAQRYVHKADKVGGSSKPTYSLCIKLDIRIPEHKAIIDELDIIYNTLLKEVDPHIASLGFNLKKLKIKSMFDGSSETVAGANSMLPKKYYELGNPSSDRYDENIYYFSISVKVNEDEIPFINDSITFPIFTDKTPWEILKTNYCSGFIDIDFSMLQKKPSADEFSFRPCLSAMRICKIKKFAKNSQENLDDGLTNEDKEELAKELGSISMSGSKSSSQTVPTITNNKTQGRGMISLKNKKSSSDDDN